VLRCGDQACAEAAFGVFGIRITDVQGEEEFAARIFCADIELTERRRFVALDGFVRRRIPAERDRI
jgi:hypothetical protein